jgi:hypothetical protein
MQFARREPAQTPTTACAGVPVVELNPSMPTQPAVVRRIFVRDVLGPSRTRCPKRKASIEVLALGEKLDRTPSFTASLTDHLQIGYTQVAVLFFACRLLHLAFFLFLRFFLCLGFAPSGTG